MELKSYLIKLGIK